jgi:O-acetyl-ADP-ribose deacetylase (regulator of RNase III)
MSHPKLKYVTGDATDPQGDGIKFIVHCCNNLGIWGAGFVLAVSKRWPKAEAAYRTWDAECRARGETLPLGQVQLVEVEPDIWVFNLIGQEGVGPKRDGTPPINYHAIHQGLFIVENAAKIVGASVHMPRMGAGLAGGDWNRIEQIIVEELCVRGVEVTVYDLARN